MQYNIYTLNPVQFKRTQNSFPSKVVRLIYAHWLEQGSDLDSSPSFKANETSRSDACASQIKSIDSMFPSGWCVVMGGEITSVYFRREGRSSQEMHPICAFVNCTMAKLAWVIMTGCYFHLWILSVPNLKHFSFLSCGLASNLVIVAFSFTSYSWIREYWFWCSIFVSSWVGNLRCIVPSI